MHKNYFEFSATTHYDLGFSMGKAFVSQVTSAISAQDKDFNTRKQFSYKMLELTKSHFPNYIDELQGYADGAGIDLLSMWTLAIEDDAYINATTYAKCTNIITNNGKLIAHSEDHFEPNLENEVCLVKKTIKKLTTFEIFYYNTLGGTSIGVNSNGYVSAGTTLIFSSKKFGIPKAIIARMFLDTQDPEKDYKKAAALQLADGYNHNIISKSGQIINIEMSANTSKITYPSSPFFHTNHCLVIPNTEDLVDDYGTITRLETAKHNTPNVTSAPQLKSVLEDSTLGNDKSIFNERTVGRLVIDLDHLECHAWLLREKDKGWATYSLDFIG